MDALLDGLNAAQRSAVTSPAFVLQVLAPPGSGKTKTLTTRIVYLVKVEHLQPWNIIACTFTLKAAREMKERLRVILGDVIVSKLILGTFHSVARRFLVRYGQEIGIPKNFGIADTSDSKAMIKRIVTRHQYIVDPSQARSRISGLKAKGTTAEQFAATSKKADQHEFACVYTEYEETLRLSNQLDYDDLLVRCVDLLRKSPACVSSIQAVLIDEYQDTNNIQYELMTLMARQMNRVTIVGDPDQSIYGFRSAEIENLYKMRKAYPETIVINLEENYRSSACIISSAKAVIEQDESRPDKSLLPTHCAGEQPTLRHLATAHVEAQWVVEEIHRSKTLSAGLLNFGDYAILLRSAALSLSIERALGKAGIPYRMVGGRRFFDRAEIKIVLDYLRVINQPDHNDALIRVINVPSRKIGEVTVKSLLEEAETSNTTLWKLVLDCAQGNRQPRTKISAQAQKGIDTFVNLILTSRRKLLPAEGEECKLLDLISHILQKISFESYLKSTHKESWNERWANVEELVAQATQMASTTSDNEEDTEDALPVVEGIEQRQDTAADILSKFLANVALSTEVEKEDGAEQNQVTISTIHAAKGLEWPVVFIPAVYEGSIPHSRSDNHDEERRLLYVGMTRAQGLLYMSCPVKQSGEGETTLSKFISSRGIQKYFSHRGPSFGCTVIGDLARILRRPCPSGGEVETASGFLERVEDDKYPLNREEIDGEGSAWSASHSNSDRLQPYKRRRTEPANLPASISASVTMHRSSSYSISTTTLPSGNTGFTTAKDLRVLQEEAESIRMLVSAHTTTAGKAAYIESKKTETKPARNKTINPRTAGQSSISSFFARPGGTVSKKPDHPAPKVSSLQRSGSLVTRQDPLSDISNVQTKPTQPRPYQPPSISTHRPRNAPMISKPKRPALEIESTRYILLSSSPVKPEDHRHAGSPDCAEDEIPLESPIKPKPVASVSTSSGFRPASTFHTTSMGQLHGQAVPQRRTLGTRRTFQGWSSKHSQKPLPRPSS